MKKLLDISLIAFVLATTHIAYGAGDRHDEKIKRDIFVIVDSTLQLEVIEIELRRPPIGIFQIAEISADIGDLFIQGETGNSTVRRALIRTEQKVSLDCLAYLIWNSTELRRCKIHLSSQEDNFRKTLGILRTSN